LVGLLNAEFSSNEGFATEQEQRDTANFFADHIVVEEMTCSIDGNEVDDITEFRFESPQFTFTAPDPWIFTPANPGPGTFVGLDETGVGSFLSVGHPALPAARVVCSEPLVLGKAGDLACGFVVFLRGGQLTLECHGWGDAIPAGFRDYDVEVNTTA